VNQNEKALELLEVIKVLESDMKFAVQNFNDSTDSNFDFWARTYVKTLGSWIEGNLWVYKYILVNSNIPKALGFSIEEQLYLQEASWKVDNRSEIKVEDKKIGVKQNIKAFMKLMSKHSSSSFEDLSGNGWKGLEQFFDIRDRLMHPKSLNGLNVNKNQIHAIEKGRIWLRSNFNAVQEVIKTASYKV